jgi:O-antigen ligase
LDWALLAGERAPGGTFGNRNFLAHLLAIALPLVALATLRAERRWARGLGLVGLAVIGAAVVLTRSRAAWLAMAASMAAIGLALVIVRRAPERPELGRRPVGLLIALALGVAAALLLPNRLQWRSDAPYAESLKGIVNYQEGSGHGRLIQYRNTLRLVPRDPVFGVGPGNWMVRYPQVTTPGDPSFSGADPIPTNPWPSSDWMAFWSERGLVGVLLLLGAGLAAALTAWRRLGRPDQALTSVALLGTLTAAVVAGLFDAVLLLAAPTLFTFAAAGALLPQAGPVLSRPLERSHRRLAIGLVLVAALAATARSAGEVAAIVTTGQTRQRSALEWASRFDPGNHRLHLYLATRGSCAQRRPHARAARALLPWHEWPRRAVEDCGG